MSLFNQVANDSPPPPPSPEKLAEQVAENIKNISLQAVQQFANAMNTAMVMLWENQVPNVSAAMIIEKLGTDAVELFSQHAAARAFLIERIPALESKLKTKPDWAVVTFEVVSGQPTGRASVAIK